MSQLKLVIHGLIAMAFAGSVMAAEPVAAPVKAADQKSQIKAVKTSGHKEHKKTATPKAVDSPK